MTQIIETPKPMRQFKFSPTDQTIRFTVADEKEFSRSYHEAPVIGETIERVADVGKLGSRLATGYEFDATCELVRHAAKESGFGDPLVRELMKRTRQSKDFAELKAVTVGDAVASALGACSLTETMVTALDEELKEQAKRERQAREDAGEEQAVSDAMAEDPEATPEQIAEQAQRAAAAQDKAQRAAQALASMLRDKGKQLGAAATAAVGQATEAAQASKAADQCFGWGAGSTDPSGGLPPAEKFRLARIIQQAGPSFKKFIELLGRMSHTAMQKQASKYQHESGEIVDVTLGDELSKVLDDELSELVNPKLRRSALSRYATETMMQHEVEQKEPKAKGDVIVLIDESGSMSGQKEAEAKAVALALAHVCAKQRRKLSIHFFQDRITASIKIDPADVHSTEDGMNVAVKKLGYIASRGAGGGTSFDEPLKAAMAEVRGGLYREADVLMITDGECLAHESTVEAVNATRRDTGCKFFAMLIGGMSAQCVASVKAFSDKVWNADSLVGKVSEELFEIL